MSERVIVYHQHDCPPCDWVMEWLDRHGVAYEVKDVVEDAVAFEELRALGSSSTPTVVVGEVVSIGFERERLAELLGIGPTAGG